MSDARSEQNKNASVLKKISKELATTEFTYIEQLEQMIATYDEILKNPKINPVQVAKIQGYLDHYRKILEVSQSLARTGVLKIGKVEDNKLDTDVSTTQAFEPFEKLFNLTLMNETLFNAYAHIIAEKHLISAALAELDDKLPKGGKFVDVLTKRYPRNTATFDSLLILPVQRLPRYEMLSEQFSKKSQLENLHPKAALLSSEAKKTSTRVNEVRAFANGFAETGLSPEKSFALAMQFKDIPKLRDSFETMSIDKFKVLDATKALTAFVDTLKQHPSKKNDKLVTLMDERIKVLVAAHKMAFDDRSATPLTLKQMQQQLHDIRTQIQKTSVDKEMKTEKQKIMDEIAKLETAIAKDIKTNPKSANASMQQTVYSEARKQSESLLLAKKHVENNGRTTANDVLRPLIEAMEKRKEKKLTPVIAQLKAQLKKEQLDLDAVRRLLQVLSDSKIKSPDLRELIAERKELADALDRQLKSSHMQDFKTGLEDRKAAKAAMPSQMQRNVGVRNIKQQAAAQQPAPASAKATISQQQKAHLTEARKRFSGQASKTHTAAATAGKAAQKVEPAVIPARPAAAHARPANLTTQKNQTAAKTASTRVQPDGNVKSVKPQEPVMGRTMNKRMTFFAEQHKQGVTQPKKGLKKGTEAPQWSTVLKKGPGRTT